MWVTLEQQSCVMHALADITSNWHSDEPLTECTAAPRQRCPLGQLCLGASTSMPTLLSSDRNESVILRMEPAWRNMGGRSILSACETYGVTTRLWRQRLRPPWRPRTHDIQHHRPYIWLHPFCRDRASNSRASTIPLSSSYTTCKSWPDHTDTARIS